MKLPQRPGRRALLLSLVPAGLLMAPALLFAQGPAALAPAPAPAAVTAPAAPASAVVVTLETTQGPIVLELDAAAAPRTVANFVQYVKDGYYDGTIFHRVISTFMIQGGGYTKDLSRKTPRAPIPSESRNGLHNVRGTLAMARTSDPDSASAQFFINVVDNPNLDYPNPDGHGYTVFGKVLEGMETVDRIRALAVKSQGMEFGHLPLQVPVIEKAKIGR
jgi:peptidyl-prolyl cis-trans isomerase A (cyclophilin A)